MHAPWGPHTLSLGTFLFSSSGLLPPRQWRVCCQESIEASQGGFNKNVQGLYHWQCLFLFWHSNLKSQLNNNPLSSLQKNSVNWVWSKITMITQYSPPGPFRWNKDGLKLKLFLKRFDKDISGQTRGLTWEGKGSSITIQSSKDKFAWFLQIKGSVCWKIHSLALDFAVYVLSLQQACWPNQLNSLHCVLAYRWSTRMCVLVLSSGGSFPVLFGFVAFVYISVTTSHVKLSVLSSSLI